MAAILAIAIPNLAGFAAEANLLRDAQFEDSKPDGTFPSSRVWQRSWLGESGAVCTTTSGRSGNGLWAFTGRGPSDEWTATYQENPLQTGNHPVCGCVGANARRRTVGQGIHGIGRGAIHWQWMQVAFEIALHTGCRLRETRIPMACVDFVENKITFPSPKGGEERAFSIPMPTALRPLLERLDQEKKKHTLEFPFQPSRRWQQFFIKRKLTHLCFHCLRVTYVNRLRRAGVPREAAMRLVNHASDLVHQVYQREKVDDVVRWRDAVTFPL